MTVSARRPSPYDDGWPGHLFDHVTLRLTALCALLAAALQGVLHAHFALREVATLATGIAFCMGVAGIVDTLTELSSLAGWQLHSCAAATTIFSTVILLCSAHLCAERHEWPLEVPRPIAASQVATAAWCYYCTWPVTSQAAACLFVGRDLYRGGHAFLWHAWRRTWHPTAAAVAAAVILHLTSVTVLEGITFPVAWPLYANLPPHHLVRLTFTDPLFGGPFSLARAAFIPVCRLALLYLLTPSNRRRLALVTCSSIRLSLGKVHAKNLAALVGGDPSTAPQPDGASNWSSVGDPRAPPTPPTSWSAEMNPSSDSDGYMTDD